MQRIEAKASAAYAELGELEVHMAKTRRLDTDRAHALLLEMKEIQAQNR
jgi:hypothetical protein